MDPHFCLSVIESLIYLFSAHLMLLFAQCQVSFHVVWVIKGLFLTLTNKYSQIKEEFQNMGFQWNLSFALLTTYFY